MSRTEAMGVTPFAPFVYHASRDDGVGLEFHIVGGEAQILQVLLPPNRSIEAEPPPTARRRSNGASLHTRAPATPRCAPPVPRRPAHEALTRRAPYLPPP